jgi:6-phosphogluconolactonase (cycloisomerase 2 family)
MCLIAGDGSITSCAISNGNGSGSNWTPYNIANNGGNYVYLTNDKNSGLVYRCNVNSTGNLQTCLSSNGGNSTWQPTGIALHGGFAYVLDYNASFVNKCNLESNGVISGCTQTGSGLTDGSNAYIYNIAFNGDYAYVTDSFYDNIYVAPVNSNGTIGAFVKAQNTLDANDIAFNTASNGVTYAYVASVGADAIQQCSIASDGVLTNCAYAISAGYPSGWTPSSIAFYNNTAYITDTSNDKIAVCPLNANGSFASCTETAGGASSWNPWSITIF